MRLYLYNTLSGKKELFKPVVGRVGLYVCGITPYDVTHLGHAFTYVFFDVVARYLRFLGYRVKYAQNLTDIDDDILKKAGELKMNWRQVVKINTNKFLSDNLWLNNLPPDIYPRATDHLKEICDIIEKLVKRGYGYVRNGNVYFTVDKFKSYGRLSKLVKARWLAIANQRGNNPNDPHKKNPLDFVLWQARRPGEPSWVSPWGRGRPGWHIECSAMAAKYLGLPLTIHGGGADLIFPHHESSLAQTKAASGKSLARYWLHTAMIKYRGEKMSKSLGNLILIGRLKEKYSANAVRLCLLSHYYRRTWEADLKHFAGAEKLNKLLNRAWGLSSNNLAKNFAFIKFKAEFFRHFNNDFYLPGALTVLKNLAACLIKEHKMKNITAAKAFLNQAFNLLGLKMEV